MAGIRPISGDLSLTSIRQQSYYAARISAAYAAAANPSQPNAPVEPVSPVRRVTPSETVRVPVTEPERRLPTEEDLNNASENLARMRIQYPEDAEEREKAASAALSQLGFSA